MNSSVDLIRAIAALAFVIGLIWSIGYLARKYGAKLGLPTAPLTGKARRLHLVESLSLDAKTRLILIKRDDAEHLLLVGTDTAQVIETSLKGPETL